MAVAVAVAVAVGVKVAVGVRVAVEVGLGVSGQLVEAVAVQPQAAQKEKQHDYYISPPDRSCQAHSFEFSQRAVELLDLGILRKASADFRGWSYRLKPARKDGSDRPCEQS